MSKKLMKNEDVEALRTVLKEYQKLKQRYTKKAKKEREKINDVSVMVCGKKCSTEQEIFEWYEADVITGDELDAYTE